MRSLISVCCLVAGLYFYSPTAQSAENCDFSFYYGGKTYCSGSLGGALAQARSILPPPADQLRVAETFSTGSGATTYYFRVPEEVDPETVAAGFDGEYLSTDICSPGLDCSSYSEAKSIIVGYAQQYADANNYCVGEVEETSYPRSGFYGGGESGPSTEPYGFFERKQYTTVKVNLEKIPGNPDCDGSATTSRSGSIDHSVFSYCPEGYSGQIASDNSWARCYSGVNIAITGKVSPQGSPDPMQCIGNPCNMLTGDKSEPETDYSAGGLEIRRNYHSAGVFDSGQLGAGWAHNYDTRLIFNTPSDPTSGIQKYISQEGTVFVIGSGSSTTRVYGLEDLFFFYDSSTSEWHLEQGQRRVVFNSEGRLKRIESGGRHITATYDANGDLYQVSDAYGRSFTYQYTDGILTSVVLPDANTIQYTYNGDLLDYVTYPDGTTRQYHYENVDYPGLLTGVTDELGIRYSTFAYDEAAQAISTEHAGGVDKYTINRLPDGDITFSDPNGAETRVGYETNWNQRHITSASSPTGGAFTFPISSREVDAYGYEKSITSLNGNTTTFQRDSFGRETSRTVAAGTPEERTFSKSLDFWTGLVNTVTEPDRTIAHTYDNDRNRLTTTITDTATSESRTTTWTYNAYGQVLSEDGPRTDVSDVTTYTYDAEGNLATATNALNQTTQYTQYDAHGNPLEIIDPNGMVTRLAYDLRQRLTSRTVAYGTSAEAITTFDYDLAGQLEKVILPDGSWIAYEYDAAHRMTAIEDSAGNRIEYTLDNAGNRTAEQVRDSGSNLVREIFRTYNTLNRLVTETGGESNAVQYGYDDEGNRTSVTDADNNTTTYQYDALNRLTKTIDALQGETTYSYDASDNLTQVVDPRGVTTDYSYNGFGELTQVDSPDAGLTTYSYDKAGNRISQTDARNVTATFSYDALNRLIAIDYPGTAKDISYSYDAGTNGVGRLTGITDESGSTTYSYDIRGQLVTKTSVVNGVTLTVDYTYDAASNVSDVIYPSGATLSFTRDAHGQISSISLTRPGQSAVTLASNIAWQPFGGISSFTYGNGLQHTRTHDLDGRLTDIDTAGSATVQDLTISWDATNNITGISNNADLSRSQTFAYDALYRLTSATGIYGNYGYDYDAVGNRTQKTEGSNTITYGHVATSNRLASITDSSGTTNVTYDAVGNILADDSNTYSYDDRNRLVQANGSHDYTHNALGQRVAKPRHDSQGTIVGEVLFVYDEAGHLIGEYDETGAPILEYLWFGDIPLAINDQSGATDETYYLHIDHLNTPKAATDDNQTIVWSADYTPFGEVTETVTSIEQPLRFPGQYYDVETGLNYNFFRTYNSSIGRYVQPDPIGLGGGVNVYTYANLRPNFVIDRYGLRGSCGAEGGLEFPSEMIVYSFEEPCARHDRCYACGESKWKCDIQFANDMQDTCLDIPPVFMYFILQCIYQLQQYTNAVMVGGDAAYDRAQDKRANDNDSNEKCDGCEG